MTTPTTRTPIRIARGTYTNLNASISDILDGEICWATDEDKIYVKDGGSLVATMLTSADVGSSVQAYDPTILKSADIGVTVQAYDANMLSSSDIGVTVEGHDATILKSADIGITVQGYDATTLKGADIGVSVQGYDADTAKLDVPQTFTAVQTLTDPTIVGTIMEDVYTISDGPAFEVDPGNGSVQLITLGASRTPKATNFSAGESITLMVDDGTAYALTWTDATWGGSGVVWTGGSAPDLATSGFTVIQLWKVGAQVYGAKVGDVA